MKFVCATGNSGKLREIRQIFDMDNAEIISMKELGLAPNIDENGATFYENACIKAKTICGMTGMPAIADDSGLCVDALDGAPGIYSARYGGIPDDSGRNEYLLRNLLNYPASKRTARFVSCCVCVFPNGDIVSATGICEGSIGFEPVGDNGFGYDPLFTVAETGKTMAQMSAEEKNSISHRAKALEKLKSELEKYLNGTDK